MYLLSFFNLLFLMLMSSVNLFCSLFSYVLKQLSLELFKSTEDKLSFVKLKTLSLVLSKMFSLFNLDCKFSVSFWLIKFNIGDAGVVFGEFKLYVGDCKILDLLISLSWLILVKEIEGDAIRILDAHLLF